MRSYPAKENPIGSADSEILRYKQTDKQTDRQIDRQTDIVLLCIIDYNIKFWKHSYIKIWNGYLTIQKNQIIYSVLRIVLWIHSLMVIRKYFGYTENTQTHTHTLTHIHTLKVTHNNKIVSVMENRNLHISVYLPTIDWKKIEYYFFPKTWPSNLRPKPSYLF